MAISDENKKFLEDLLQYYIDQADSYSQFASEYGDFSKSKREIAFELHDHYPQSVESYIQFPLTCLTRFTFRFIPTFRLFFPSSALVILSILSLMKS